MRKILDWLTREEHPGPLPYASPAPVPGKNYEAHFTPHEAEYYEKWRGLMANRRRNRYDNPVPLTRLYHRIAAVNELLLLALEKERSGTRQESQMRLRTAGSHVIPFNWEALIRLRSLAAAHTIRIITAGKLHDVIAEFLGGNTNVEMRHAPLKEDLVYQHHLSVGESAYLLTAPESHLSWNRDENIPARANFSDPNGKKLTDLFDKHWDMMTHCRI